MQSLTCTCCGAAVHFTDERCVTCSYCGQTFDTEEFHGQRRGELLLGADFRDPNLPGWHVYAKEHLSFGDRGLPWVVGNFPKNEGNTWLVESYGSFDNFDAGVTISFLQVADVTSHCRLGFAFRWTKSGHYSADIAPKGNYCVARYEKEKPEGNRWTMLVDYANHPALRSGVGVGNRLRMVARDDHLRLYINNVMVSSVRDSMFSYGTVGIVLENGGTDAVVSLSNLEIRDVPDPTD